MIKIILKICVKIIYYIMEFIMGIFKRPIKTAADNITNTTQLISHVVRHVDSLIERYEKQGFVEIEVKFNKWIKDTDFPILRKWLGSNMSTVESFLNTSINLKIKLPE